MLKNFLRSIIPPPTLHLSRSRGQAMVLFALLIPLLILFVGVGMDLGWYYLNVSRLQNAADAAALAGARTIINSNSGKLKDLAPVLVQKLPADNGLTDDGEPKVETSTSTETTQTSTETDEGTTITTTETTTTTTTTTSKTKLEDLTWTDGDATTRNYTAKNLGTTQNIQADEGEVVSLIIDSWSLFDSTSDKQVDTDLNLVKVNGDFYYIVTLDENIRHFFLPGWFNAMEAKVVAIAQLVPKDQVKVDKIKETNTWEEFIAKVREIINRNVIVGNWEVQNWYKSMEDAYERDNDGNYVDADGNPVTEKNKVVAYAKDINGNFILDSNGNKMKDFTNIYNNSIAYTKRFGAEIYAGAWNHFQDFFNHFWATGYHDPSTASDPMLIAGDFYRVETVTVRDDVNSASDRPYGSNSSVAATSASINKKPGHVNNPGKSTKKTYAKYKDKDGTMKDITDTGNVGLPYKWEYLDSINVDFKPEVTLPDKWIGKDWDVSLEDNSGVSFNYKNWATPGQSGNVVITDKYIKHMRIHANINFDEPYKERSDLEPPRDPYKEELREKDAAGNLLPDILWGRIESEPMLFYPDALNGYETHMEKKQTALSSVRQIIINVNSSNYNTGSVNYRPVIIFYDGPERYSTEDKTRESRPVILNLGKPFRGVLYAPNSPVVITGSEAAKNQFKGFVVAKNYMRLKNDNDFTFGGYRYFNSKDKQWEYFRSVDANGKITYRDVGGNLKTNRDDSNTYKVAYYYAKDDNSGTKYYRTVENETIIDNGVETPTGNELVLYTDEYGEVQFAEVDGTFKYKIGEYDNFGRTDFTAQQYHIAQTSADNLLLSSK